MKAEITLIGRSGMTSLTSASSARCLGYAGRHYITTKFSTSFGIKRDFLRNRNLYLWDQRRCLVKCMHTLVAKALQEHKSMPYVSVLDWDSQTLASINDFV